MKHNKYFLQSHVSLQFHSMILNIMIMLKFRLPHGVLEKRSGKKLQYPKHKCPIKVDSIICSNSTKTD
jgi:hypothetical protein